MTKTMTTTDETMVYGQAKVVPLITKGGLWVEKIVQSCEEDGGYRLDDGTVIYGLPDLYTVDGILDGFQIVDKEGALRVCQTLDQVTLGELDDTGSKTHVPTKVVEIEDIYRLENFRLRELYPYWTTPTEQEKEDEEQDLEDEVAHWDKRVDELKSKLNYPDGWDSQKELHAQVERGIINVDKLWEDIRTQRMITDFLTFGIEARKRLHVFRVKKAILDM